MSSKVSLTTLQPKDENRHEVSDLLSSTIRDFESLMDEALLLARQATLIQNVLDFSIPDPPSSKANDSTASLSPDKSMKQEVDQIPDRREEKAKQPPLIPPRYHTLALSDHPKSFSNPIHGGVTTDSNTIFKSGLLDFPPSAAVSNREKQDHLQRRRTIEQNRLNRSEIRKYTKAQKEAIFQPRTSSQHGFFLDYKARKAERRAWREAGEHTFRHSPESESILCRDFGNDLSRSYDKCDAEETEPLFTRVSNHVPNGAQDSGLDLHNTRHIDLYGHKGISLCTSCRHQPIARNWHNHRKRCVAIVACLNTALVGFVIGIYGGEVPAIQYAIADLHHYAILGNVFLYLGLAIPTLFFWPLPLLHGRKLYTVAGLAVALPLQIPQAVAVGAFRSPYVMSYRVVLLFCRGLSGLALGFAAINFKPTLLDLFGASLMSANPHQEVIQVDDVRRHGGGMGLWLGWWSWCTIGPISFGFLVGAAVVNSVDVTWGFWLSIFIILCIMFLNIICPEVRRSAYRRTFADVVKKDGEMVRRVARGEIKMHLRSRGPLWWGEEVKAGIQLCWKMLKQPGFSVLTIYLAWVYAQFTLVLMLLSALISKYYHLRPIYVGICVSTMALGALAAIPFQKASLFSRARHHPQRTNSMTFEKRVDMSSHLIRRIVFMILLPIAILAHTLTANGPPVHPVWPTVTAAVVAFLSNLAIAECNGLIMETFDVSDLQPGLSRQRKGRDGEIPERLDFSCHPRVTAGITITQGISYIFTAAATAACGGVERRLGARLATGIFGAILMGLTISLTMVLVRVKTVQLIPKRITWEATEADEKELEQNPSARHGSGWKLAVGASLSGMTTRRVSLLELGTMTRWTEIRDRNRLPEQVIKSV